MQIKIPKGKFLKDIHKNECDKQCCPNHSGIKLATQTMKHWEQVMKGESKSVLFDYTSENSNIYFIYLIKQQK